MRGWAIWISVALCGVAGCDEPQPEPEPYQPYVDAGKSVGAAKIAWTGSEIGLLWTNFAEDDLFFARFEPDGHMIGEPTRVTTSFEYTLSHDLVWTGTEFGVSLSDERPDTNVRHQYFLAINPDGTPRGPRQQISVDDQPVCGTRGTESCAAPIGWSGTRYGLAFSTRDDGLRFATTDRDGTAQTLTEIPAPWRASFRQHIAWTGSEFLVGPYEDRLGGVVVLLHFSEDGQLLSEQTPLPPQIIPWGTRWSLDGSEIFFGWISYMSYYELNLRRIDLDGNSVGGEASTYYHTYDPVLLRTGDSYAAVWADGRKGGDTELYVANFGPDLDAYSEQALTDDLFHHEELGAIWTGESIAIVSRDRDRELLGPDGLYLRFAPLPSP